MNRMHRRLNGWNYACKCNYMVTLVTDPRRPRFGICREYGIERSPEGKILYDVWQRIPIQFPEVRASYYVVMPDHFHGILYFQTQTTYTLMDVVEWFRSETERIACERLWAEGFQDSICLHAHQLARMIAYVLDNPKRLWVKKNNPELFMRRLGFEHPRLPVLRQKAGVEKGGMCRAMEGDPLVLPRRSNRRVSLFFEPRSDNFLSCASCSIPGWRLLPDDRYQALPGTLPVDTFPDTVETAALWTAIGNPFLLEGALLVAVRFSRQTPKDVGEEVLARIQAKVERGAVVVTPALSPLEQQVKRCALDEGGRVIQLVSHGFSPFTKPGGRDFDACAKGQLLQLTAFESETETEVGRDKLGKAKCEWMNAAAEALADVCMGWPGGPSGRRVG